MTAVDAASSSVRGPAQVSVSFLRRSVCAIARLRGDLDTAATPALRERLLGLLGPGVRLLVIDLSGVSFCDAAGLAMLVSTQRRAAARRITVRLAAPRPQTAKLLRITGLDRSLTVCTTLADALAQRPEPANLGIPTAPQATQAPPAR